VRAIVGAVLLAAAFVGGTVERGLAAERVDITATDGVQLIGHLSGTSGPGVVLIPAVARDTRTWAVAADRLAARGFRVLRFDLRGHGDSDGPADRAALDRDAEGAFRYLIGRKVRPVALVGEGEGGPVAVDLARRLPVEAVAVVGNAADAPDRPARPRSIALRGELGDDAVLDAIVRLLQGGSAD
jgi:pimeloyl-ACP methyl ester carboxylesterase